VDESAIMLGLLAHNIHEKLLESDTTSVILTEEQVESLSEIPMLFIDAGSMSDERGFVTKLALFTRVKEGNKVREAIYHPVPKVEKKWFLPIFFSSENDKARQAFTYLIELAAIYAALTNPRKVFKRDVDKAMIFRHGPLVQMLSQYLSEPYLVNAYDAINALIYAGLSERDALTLVEDAYKCDSKGGIPVKDRNVVILGLLILNLLKKIKEEVDRNRKIAVLGVVEDVSQSKSLLAYSISRILCTIRREAKSYGGLSADHLASLIATFIMNKMQDLNFEEVLRDCLCLDLNHESFTNIMNNVEYAWIDLIEHLEHFLRTRFRKGLAEATPSEVEAAFLWSGLTEMNDAYFMYTLYYVSKNKVPFTKPIENKARFEIFKRYLKSKKYLKCYSEYYSEMESIDDLAEVFMYRYIAPVYPLDELRCNIIKEVLSRNTKLNVGPCAITNLITVPSPMRIEFISGEPLVKEGLSFAFYSSILTTYGFPTQLLLVDRYSRVSILDLLSIEDLLDVLSKRFKPYSVFVHKWITRRAFM